MARTAGSDGKATAARARQAALALFARHGYAAVSMREIAGEVGVGAAALYNHFTTKQDLLAELMTAHLAELLTGWAAEPLAAEGADPVAALDAFTRFHIRFHAGRQDDVFVAYMELRSLEPPNYHRIERLRRTYEDQLTAILARGAAAGVIHAPDPRVATMAIIAMLTGVTTWYRQGGRLSAAEIEDIYADMVARAVRAGAPEETGETACSPHP